MTNRDALPSLRSSDNSFDLNENENNYVYVEQLSLVKINLTRHYGTEIDTESSIFFLNKNKNVIFFLFFFSNKILNFIIFQ
jgi:hypothetical protein